MLPLTLWVLLVALSAVRCAPSQQCIGDLSNLTLNPNGGTCQSRCDCNNQNYEGRCVNARCVARRREPCTNPGELRTCFQLAGTPEEKCKSVSRCQDGLLREKLWGDCKPLHPFVLEVGAALCADGIDNDCDGKIDSVDSKCPQVKPPGCKQGEQRPCYSGPDGSLNKGICVAGIQKCSAGEWGDCIGEVKPAGREACNGKDDNCDGTVDEGFAGLGDACSVGVGGCSVTGRQACNADGTGVECDARAGAPVAEVCDGKDNDCNGKVDDVAGGEPCCTDGETRGCFGAKSGCTEKDGKYTCEGTCLAGKQTCTNYAWGACEGALLPKAEECNGKDDDCDGGIDEGGDGKALTRPCYASGLLGCSLGADGKYTCLGTCQTGTQTCQRDTREWGACTGAVVPQSEACGSMQDLNCDGRVNRSCVETFAGGAGGFGDGPALQAKLSGPQGLVLGSSGELYLADLGNHRIRKLTKVQGVTCGTTPNYTGWCVSTVAGDGMGTDRDGPAAQAGLGKPHSLRFDSKGALYISQWGAQASGGHKIRKMEQVQNARCGSATNYTGWCMTTVACQGTRGHADGAALAGECDRPSGMMFDASGNLLFADQMNHRIRMLSPQGILSTFAGRGLGTADGPALQATFSRPVRLLADGKSAFYVADYGVRGTTIVPTKIRRVEQIQGGSCGSQMNYTGWCVSTFAGSGTQGFLDGPALQAEFAGVHDIIADGKGAFLIADYQNNRIRKIAEVTNAMCGSVAGYTGWCVTTLAGSGVQGLLDGPALQAQFFAPTALLLHDGYLYIVDTGNHRIRRMRYP